MSTALVTGSTSGIGAATAALLADEGYDVVVSGRDVDRGEAVVGKIVDRGGSARFVAADLDDLDSVRHLATSAGDVDVLVNNAGDLPGCAPRRPGRRLLRALLRRQRARAVLPHRCPRPGHGGPGQRKHRQRLARWRPRSGCPGSRRTPPPRPPWSPSPAPGPSSSAGSGIRVNTVAPGPTATDSFAAMGPENTGPIAASTILKRAATPEEIARVIVLRRHRGR